MSATSLLTWNRDAWNSSSHLSLVVCGFEHRSGGCWSVRWIRETNDTSWKRSSTHGINLPRCLLAQQLYWAILGGGRSKGMKHGVILQTSIEWLLCGCTLLGTTVSYLLSNFTWAGATLKSMDFVFVCLFVGFCFLVCSFGGTGVWAQGFVQAGLIVILPARCWGDRWVPLHLDFLCWEMRVSWTIFCQGWPEVQSSWSKPPA
jgi:hypothetical protein